MAKDRIRHLIFRWNRWRWRTTAAMRAAGFREVKLSEGLIIDGMHVPSPADIATATELNQAWDRHRRGLPPLAPLPRHPQGSIGDGYDRAVRLRDLERKSRGVVWSSEQHSRDDWPRAWKHLCFLADCDPKTVTPEMLLALRQEIARASPSEAHRVIKVWRALWVRMARFGYCDAQQDPSRHFANTAPPPRQAYWREGEAVRLVKTAWRSGYIGLAACLAVAWDSQLSPVDARRLSVGQLRRDQVGAWFDVERAKTGRRALGTLSRRTQALLHAYIDTLPTDTLGTSPMFRNRTGRPYSKDSLGDDFRTIRAQVFGAAEKRQMADFRRTGTVEALAGNADPTTLAAKMANTISASNRLHKTYAPVQLAKVRDADDARRRGRAKLRDQKG